MKKIIVLFFLLVLFNNYVFSKGIKKANLKQFKSTQDGITDYSLGQLNYVFWHSATSFRGNFVIGYERAFTENLSWSAAVGITYRDLLYEASQNKTFKDLSFTDSSGGKITFKNGYFLEGGFKYYPTGYNDFRSFYIGSTFAIRGYRATTDLKVNARPIFNPDGSGPIDIIPERIQTLKINYTIFDPAIKFGYMFEHWRYPGMIVDTYIGLGYRIGLIRGSEVKYNDPNADALSRYVIGYETKTKVISNAAIYLGFKVGFVF